MERNERRRTAPPPILKKGLSASGDLDVYKRQLVPFILCGAGTELRRGRLADIAPTILDVMGLEQPEEMDGKTLIVR